MWLAGLVPYPSRAIFCVPLDIKRHCTLYEAPCRATWLKDEGKSGERLRLDFFSEQVFHNPSLVPHHDLSDLGEDLDKDS